jgi:hypothetical protein
VVLWQSAEKQRRNAPGQPGLEGKLRAGPPYYTDQTSDQTGWHGKKKHLQSWCKLCGFKTVYLCNQCRLKPDLVILVQPRFWSDMLRDTHASGPLDFIFVFFTFGSIAMFSLFISIALKPSWQSSFLVHNLCLLKSTNSKKRSGQIDTKSKKWAFLNFCLYRGKILDRQMDFTGDYFIMKEKKYKYKPE